ncbi:Isochorismatase hydrolase [Basidiobolus meristosporus CBS 931.73]|uniref:Isochorismatase hydrolase n=1 Tax=Basidiobolus meristosporus CBS 931.73 TaxID=1314790 RepID=A0A1Y1YP24_9FUNG|nr:Isochorismatase hydrolase [Basidiobolus meristosporus CBS 931.73]|eukprot:ORX99334.1 Isochorismatase hydrolase [Basidiobolus meristosporus CBS 931.73]
MSEITFDRTAFLFCDFIKDFWKIFPDSEEKQQLLENVSRVYQRVVELREEKNLLLVNVGIKFREGYPELGPDNPNLAFKWLMQMKKGMLLESSPGTEFIDEVAPVPGSVRINKLRGSAFYPNELEAILKANQINHLVICGISTSGVVLGTCSTAADYDYKVTVIGDCCADLNPELHEVLLKSGFGNRARVTTTKELLALLDQVA